MKLYYVMSWWCWSLIERGVVWFYFLVSQVDLEIPEENRLAMVPIKLRQKMEEVGLDSNLCIPGQYNNLICPMVCGFWTQLVASVCFRSNICFRKLILLQCLCVSSIIVHLALLYWYHQNVHTKNMFAYSVGYILLCLKKNVD